VDTEHPIGCGMPRDAHLCFVHSPVFQTSPPPRLDIDRRVIVRYPSEGDVLASGWIQNEGVLRGRSALVEVTMGDGRVVLFGFRPQHRAQTWATYKLLFNAIHLSAAEQTKLPQ
ncbi:MAG: peptidase M14, partial [Planctomycetota bacterium]|jgi:hypothetical protein